MNRIASYIEDKLNLISNELKGYILDKLAMLGGKVCFAYYHNECDLDRYTFFTTNNDGYGVELFLVTGWVDYIETGKVYFTLEDSEQSYRYEYDLDTFTATELLYILNEIENVQEYLEKSEEEIVTEEDYD